MQSESEREELTALPPGFPSNELPLLSSIFYKNLSSPSGSRKDVRQEDSQGSMKRSREDTFVVETSLRLETSTAGSSQRVDSSGYNSLEDASQNEPGSTGLRPSRRPLQEGSRRSLRDDGRGPGSSRSLERPPHYKGRDLLPSGGGSGLMEGRESMLPSDHSSSASEADSTDAAIRLAESSLLEALERRKASSLGVGPALLEDIERPLALEDSQLPGTPIPLHSPLEAELERLSSALASRDDELRTVQEELKQLRRASKGYQSPYEVQKREEAALRREAELLQTLNGVEEDLTKAQAELSEERAQRVSLESATSELQLEVTEFLDTELAVAQHLRERAEQKAEAERQKRKKLEEKIRARKVKRGSSGKGDRLTVESSEAKVAGKEEGDDLGKKRRAAGRKGGHVPEAGTDEEMALARSIAQTERGRLSVEADERKGGEHSEGEDRVVMPQSELKESKQETLVETVEERAAGQPREASVGKEARKAGEEARETAEGSSRSADAGNIEEEKEGQNEQLLQSSAETEQLKRELEKEREARAVTEARVNLLLEHRAAMEDLVRLLSGTLLEKLAEMETLNRRLEDEMNGSSGYDDAPAIDIVAALASRSGADFSSTQEPREVPSASALGPFLNGGRLNRKGKEIENERQKFSIGLNSDGNGSDRTHSSAAQGQENIKGTAVGVQPEESQVALDTISGPNTGGEKDGKVRQAAARVGDEGTVERGPSTAEEQRDSHNMRETGNGNQATGKATGTPLISPSAQGGKSSCLLDAKDKALQDKGPSKGEVGKATKKQGSKARGAKIRSVEGLVAAKKSRPPWTNRNARSVLPERQWNREAYRPQLYDEKSRARNLNLRSVLMVKCRRCDRKFDLNDLDDRTCGSHPGYLGPLGYTCCGNLPTRPGRKVDFCSWQHHVA